MSRQLIDVPLRLLDDGPNVRAKADAQLAASIREHGVLQPITVCRRGDRFEVLYGHRRTAAARHIRLRTIPAILERGPDDLPIRQIIENLDRRALDPIDVARGLRAHLDAHPGLTQTELGRTIGRSSYYVSTKLALLELDSVTQAKVSRREIHEDLARRAAMARTEQTNGRRRSIQLDSEHGRSRSIVVPLVNQSAGKGSATIGVDLGEGRRLVDLVIEDGSGRSMMFSLSPDEARVLGRRLTQAYQAVASVMAELERRSTSAITEAQLEHGGLGRLGARTLTEVCACGGVIVAEDHPAAIADAVHVHNSSTEHAQWAISRGWRA